MVAAQRLTVKRLSLWPLRASSTNGIPIQQPSVLPARHGAGPSNADYQLSALQRNLSCNRQTDDYSLFSRRHSSTVFPKCNSAHGSQYHTLQYRHLYIETAARTHPHDGHVIVASLMVTPSRSCRTVSSICLCMSSSFSLSLCITSPLSNHRPCLLLRASFRSIY